MSGAVWIDYAADPRVAAMSVAGMSVLERVLREAARGGTARAVVRVDAAGLPDLSALPVIAEIVSPSTPIPPGSPTLAGDLIAGVRITDERSRRRAERALLETCRRPYDGLGDRYVNRAVSLRLTRVLARWGATPNQVTCANIAVGLAACGFTQRGTTAALMVGGALIWLQVILDSCDGELARIRYLGSRLGMWLDNVSDDIIDNLFVVALGVGLGGMWAPVGIAAAVLRGSCALMIYRAVARAGNPGDVMAFQWWFDNPQEQLAERFETRLTPLAVARSLGRRDLYVLVWGVTCVAGLPAIAFGLGVAISVGYFGLAVAHVIATRGAAPS